MRSRHIAFLLEQAYGHIIPTLGIAMELMQRGYRVSYAVTPDFVPPIRRAGAQAVVFNPIDTRTETLQLAASPGGNYEYDLSRDLFLEQVKEAKDRRTASSLAQLQECYRHDRPDLVVHNDYLDVAGRTLAKDWGIAKVRIHSRAVLPAEIPMFADDSLVLVLVPKFFNGDVGHLDERFQFVGFIAEGRNEIAQPWPYSGSTERTILASTSTGLPNQAEFCHLMMKAFGDGSFDVVLSVPGDFDPLSAIDSASIGALPEHFRLNKYSAHLELVYRTRRAWQYFGGALLGRPGDIDSTHPSSRCRRDSCRRARPGTAPQHGRSDTRSSARLCRNSHTRCSDDRSCEGRAEFDARYQRGTDGRGSYREPNSLAADQRSPINSRT
jgi:hypothetical protein